MDEKAAVGSGRMKSVCGSSHNYANDWSLLTDRPGVTRTAKTIRKLQNVEL